ncbi:putative disease resistance protein RGA1 [Acorus calamus]|uniref:Disease resistance protein RGA1 n=1 Tax=Acorus calamus TaxID=4465 RepID=A0AAV9EQ37_ACOCL|nr:putative disease resistance protein RGA1 [Acorus calamus]
MALRRKYSKSVWNDTLRSLLSPAVGKTDLDEMYELLRFSYDQLSDDIKNCFLYAALYPDGHDIYIDDLIEYWKAEGFFEDCKSFADAHDRVATYWKLFSMLPCCREAQGLNMYRCIRCFLI